MQVLQAGGGVAILRFLPDGRRLLAGVTDTLPFERDKETTVRFVVLPAAGGDPVRLDLPPLPLRAWWYDSHYGNAVAVHPSGDRCWVAWDGRLYACRTADGARLPGPEGVDAHQVTCSPDGARVLAAWCRQRPGEEPHILTALTTEPQTGQVIWRRPLPQAFTQLVGFMPDGDRYVSAGAGIYVHSFATGDGQLVKFRGGPHGAHPALSPDGRYVGLTGYGSMGLYDLAYPGGRPKTIRSGSNFGDFRSFAFHPDGQTLAVVHGGPTLVKLYDLESLTVRAKLNWKLGPLNAVAFSPDGTLGAAGSDGGRVVVWDVDS